MDAIYQQFVAGKQKAIAAFVVGFVVTYVAQYGLDLHTLTVQQLLEQLVYSGLSYAGVYLKRNK